VPAPVVLKPHTPAEIAQWEQDTLEAARIEQEKADKAAAHMEAISLAGFSAEEALQFFGALPKELEANESWKQHLLPLPTFEAQLHYKQRFTEVLSHC
jgi:hypothetical protein